MKYFNYFLKVIAIIIIYLYQVQSVENTQRRKLAISHTTDLIAYYPFAGNANDIHTGNRHGTAIDVVPTTNRHGTANSAYEFSTVSTVVFLPVESQLNGKTSVSMMAWVKINIKTGVIFSGSLVGGNDFIVHDNSNFWYGNTSYNFSINPGQYIKIGKWHHIAYVVDNGKTLYYVDGILVDSQIVTPYTLNFGVGGFLIGQDQDSLGGGFAYGSTLKGCVSDVRIYGNKVSAKTIKQIYLAEREFCNTNCASCNTARDACLSCSSGKLLIDGQCLCPQGTFLDQLSDLCIVHDKTFGNTLAVYYPLQNNGTDTINNEEGVVTGCPSVPNRFGTPNSAYQFVSTTTWVNMPSAARFLNGRKTLSISLWARKRTSLTVGLHLLTGSFAGENEFLINLNHFIMNDLGVPPILLQQELDNLVDWSHYVFVFEPTWAILYFDGRKIQKFERLEFAPVIHDNGFVLGQDQDALNGGFAVNEHWIGDISDFKMFSSAFDQQEVYNLYQSELYPCSFECQACKKETSICASCKGNRVKYLDTCICPQGTQEDFKSENCPTIDPIIEADLLAYYPFHNNATDVENGNDGTIHGVTPTTNMRGEANSAYQFTGLTTWVTIPEGVVNGLSQVSFSIWVKRTGDASNGNQFFIDGTLTGANDLTLGLGHIDLDNTMAIHSYYPEVKDTIIGDTWYHFVAVLETLKAHIYLNGELRYSGAHPAFTFNFGVGGFLVGQEQDALAGGFDPNQCWIGGLSNYRIYQSALTGDKIKDIYYNDYYPCYFPCLSCVYESIDCAFCRGDRVKISGKCLCPSGQFEDMQSTNCPQCSHQCATCEFNNLNCLTCKGNNRKNDLPNCTCIDKYYDDGTSDCKQCAVMCAQCETTSSNCTACQGHNRNNDDEINNCPCWIGFVEDGTDHCKATPTFCTDRLETINTVEGMKGWNNRDYTYDSLHADLKRTGSKLIKMSIFYPQDVDCQIDVEEKFDAYFTMRSTLKDAELATQGWIKTSIVINVVGSGGTTVSLLVFKKSGVGSFQIPQLQYEDEYELSYNSIFYVPLGCDNSCNKCSGTINTCTECGTSTPVRSGASCICPASYFDDQINTQCGSCEYQCATCTTSSSQCDTCSDSTNRITSPTCNCKTHFYDQGNPNPVCLECNHKCLDCTNNATNCSSCQGANRQNLANLCICQDAFYDDGSNKDCQSCNYKCATCSNNSSCDTCNDPTNRTNAACDCKTHFYDQGTSNPLCLECSNKCLECSGSATNCDSCQGANRKDLANLCVCQDGFYDDGVNKDCQQCDNSCVTCSGSATDCTGSVCSDPDFDISTDCVSCLGTKTVNSSTCKCLVAGEFDDGTITCKNCDYQCATCSGTASSCSTCADPSNRTNGACDCKSHFYDQNNSNPICLECNHKCLECSGTANNCDSCQGANRKDQANQCVCLDSFYDNGSNKDCLSCDYQCATCTSSASQCDTCSDSTNRINSPTCSCKTHFYDQGNSDPVCLECDHKCQECSNNATNCSSCQGANRKDLASQCVCQGGFYDDGVNSDCKPCDSSCSLCSGSATNCIGSSCADTDFDISSGCTLCLGTKQIDAGACKCLTVGEFDDSTFICATCEYQCASCSGTADGCQTCNDPINRINAQCDCKSHYYDQQNGLSTCLECNYKCLDCSGSSDACQSCQGVNRTSNIPSCECELGYFDIGVADCSQCDSKCGECEGTLDNCINSCSGANRDLGNKCQCLDGYFGSGNCDSQCDIQCLQCSTTPANCLVCKGLNRDNTDLPNCKCLPGYYNDGIISDCQKCQVNNCVECDSSDPTICKKEEDGYYLEGNTPVQCKFGCKKCETASDNCNECELSVPPRIKSDSCSCSEGYYENNEDFQCQNCLPECKSCENDFECIEMKTCESQCLKCEKNKENCTICLGLNRLKAPSCSCQDGYYDNGQDTDCQQCKNSQCKSCDIKNSNQCIECLNSDLLPPNCSQYKKGNFVSNSVSIGDKEIQQTYDCDPKCEQCVKQSNNCRICSVGLYRLQNLPDCGCKVGYHDRNGQQKDCEECNELCKSCSDRNQCDICADGLNRELNFFNKQCECQSGYKESKNSDKCEKCYYLGQYCVSQCPDNTILNEKSNVCDEVSPVQSENLMIFIICGCIVVLFQIGIFSIIKQLVKNKSLRLKNIKSDDQQQEEKGDCQKLDINSFKNQEEKDSSIQQSIGIDEVENL